MKYFKNAIKDIRERLNPLVDMETFYSLNNQRIHDSNDIDYPLEFNKRTYWMIGELYYSEDAINRDIVILNTNLNYLQGSDFNISNFYFGGQYIDLENMVIQGKNPVVIGLKKSYTLEKSQIMWNIADAKRIIKLLNINISNLFLFHKKMYYTYNSKDNNKQNIQDINEDVEDGLLGMFKLRIKIAENLQYIFKEISEFENHIEFFKNLFESIQQLLQVSPNTQNVSNNGPNAESHFSQQEADDSQKTMKYTIEQKLINGDIQMANITDPQIANDIMTHPLSTDSTNSGISNQNNSNSTSTHILATTTIIGITLGVLGLIVLIALGYLLKVCLG